MEDIFPLLAVVIIYAVTYVFKKSFSNGDQEMGEAFPPIEVLGSGEETAAPDAGDSSVPSDTGRVATSSHQRSTAPDRETRRADEGRRATEDADNVAHAVHAAHAENRDKRFSIKGKSEAKRAFIYSEIFGRKYQ